MGDVAAVKEILNAGKISVQDVTLDSCACMSSREYKKRLSVCVFLNVHECMCMYVRKFCVGGFRVKIPAF